MKSFQSVLVLATYASALVIPGSIVRRDDGCTPGLYQCAEDGEHFQQCTAAKTWSVSMQVAAGMECTPGISENPFHAAGDDDECTSESDEPPEATSTSVAVPAPTTPSSTIVATTSSDPPPPPPPSSTAVATTSDLPAPPPPQVTTSSSIALSTSTSVSVSIPLTTAPAVVPTTLSTFPVSTGVVSETSSSAAQATTSAAASDPPPPPPPPPAASTTASSTPSEAPHTTNAAPTTNPSAGSGPTVGEVCMEFTSDNPDWTWSLAGPWTVGKSDDELFGTFGDLPGGKLCVQPHNDAGGAMFIGSQKNPQGGNTKLEAYFPTSGEANVDISIVDGYSLSVTCTAGDVTAGGSLDLWKTGAVCENIAPGGICSNTLAYKVSGELLVNPFFLPSTINGQRYCDWVNCNEDYFFPVTTTMSCHVSGSVPN